MHISIIPYPHLALAFLFRVYHSPMRLLNLPRWLVVLVILFAVGLLAALLLSPRVRPAKDFPGSLVLSIPVPWTAPTGEVVSGLVKYAPGKGEVGYVMAPGFPALDGPGAVSPDGTQILVSLTSTTTTSLVSYSTLTQSIQRVVAQASPSVAFRSPLWSPTMGNVAYLRAEDRKDAPPVSLRIAPEFPGQPDYGFATPLAFSTDGSRVLAMQPLNLAIVDTLGGGVAPVAGMEDTRDF